MRNKQLVEYLRAEWGRQSRLAEDLGVSSGAIHQWVKRKVPAERLYEVARLTGIPAQVLRPDIEKQRRKIF